MIRDVIDKLNLQDRRLLSYAFDHELSQVVKLKDNKFVGVNVYPSTNLIIEEKVGSWSCGSIK